jgi:hypothetical protein
MAVVGHAFVGLVKLVLWVPTVVTSLSYNLTSSLSSASSRERATVDRFGPLCVTRQLRALYGPRAGGLARTVRERRGHVDEDEFPARVHHAGPVERRHLRRLCLGHVPTCAQLARQRDPCPKALVG